jgi:hypothetical protein
MKPMAKRADVVRGLRLRMGIKSLQKKKARKRFFFEKKNQKTFIRWSPVNRPLLERHLT